MVRKSWLALFAAGVVLVGGSADAGARVIMKEKTRYYSVNGSNGTAIYKEMARKGRQSAGGGKHDFIASATITFDSRNVKGGVVGNSCVIKDMDVVVNVVFAMPKWKQPKNASPALIKAWKAFQAHVWAHERRHAQIGKEAAAEMIQAMRRIKGDARKDCAGMDKKVDAPIKRIMKRYEERQAAFDASPFGIGGKSYGFDRALIRTN